MLCEKCKKNNANIHYTQSFNGSKTQIHLCEACAREKMNVNIDFTSQLGQIFPNMFSAVTEKGMPQKAANRAAVPRCDKCGMTFYEFRETGKLGCVKCYSTFADSVRTVIKRIHSSVEHSGKMTEKAGEIAKQEASRAAKMKELKIKLSRAIESEEYEKAAVFRDEIRALENPEKWEKPPGKLEKHPGKLEERPEKLQKEGGNNESKSKEL